MGKSWGIPEEIDDDDDDGIRRGLSFEFMEFVKFSIIISFRFQIFQNLGLSWMWIKMR
jgi:hypothetical protein